MSNLTRHEVLSKYFGHESFRPGQEDIVRDILNGRDVLGVLPTGGGKSLCYQLPALMMEGLTLVISPLISLMQDQITQLHQQGIPAAYLNSSLQDQEYFDVLDRIRANELKLLYIAPERLDQEGFLAMMAQQDVSMIAVDEAHCVSQWGHDFRSAYRNIHTFIDYLPHRPVVTAFSATATDRVQDDIVKQLALRDPQIFINSFDRPNIRFTVEQPINKERKLLDLVNKEDSIIIYAQTRKLVDKVAETLAKRGYNVRAYHAGHSAKNRMQAQDDFIFDRVNIIVATNAFGMGIDKTDVRQVIHYNMPTDLESYYQEAGRGGRDGLESEATLLFSNQDIMTANFLIQDSQDPSVYERLQSMINFANHTGCLRQYILNYFGEAHPGNCQNCSSCLGVFKTQDVTTEAQMILSCIVRMKSSFGSTMITNVLRGSRNQKVLDWNFDKLSTYGLMKNYTESEVKDIISQLTASGYLRINEFRGLELTATATDILQGIAKLTVKEDLTKKKKAPKKPRKEITSYLEHEELFERLRDLRYELASEMGVPAYIVFNNSSLEDMCEILPTTIENFLTVDGVGDAKAERYFEPFSTVIIDYMEENGLD